MPSSIRELRVWQEAVGTAGEIAKLARKTRPESRALVDILIRCSAEVALSIARGHAKEGAVAQRDGFRTARDAIASLETGLAIARHAELFPLPACADLGVRASHTARLIAGYIAYLDRLVNADAEAEAAQTTSVMTTATAIALSGQPPSVARDATPPAALAEAVHEVYRSEAGQ